MQALCDWIQQLQSELADADIRMPVRWLVKPEAAQHLLNRCLPPDTLWLDSGAPSPMTPPPQVMLVRPNQAQHYLGGEHPMLVVDGYSGVDANMLLMLAGTLKPGGIALILLPPACPNCTNGALVRYLSHGQPLPRHSRWIKRLMTLPGSMVMGQPWRLPRRSDPPPPLPPPPMPDAHTLWLITGRRGRGKSTLLARLADQHPAATIVLVTNHTRALNTFQRHLRQLGWQVPDTGVPLFFSKPISGGRTRTLKILPPDAFLAQKPPCELLLVDEAARLTLPVLRKLLQWPVPMALATTLEGYEGAGQGLRLKLTAHLPPGRQLEVLTLTHSRRWAANDPLERWLDNVCLLQSPTPHPPTGPTHISPWHPGEDEDTLQAAWSLLQRAHYQTRPSDLMQLLDRPDQRLWLARTERTVAGVLWTLEEGGLSDPPLHVRGHLAAQRLRQLTGDDAWLKRRSLRITRIAVHPQRQHEGIGTALINTLKETSDVDFLSVSCAAEPRLLRFWEKQGFERIHVGDKPNRASGVPSALLVYDLRT